MEDLKKIQEFFSKPLEEGTFDQGEIAIYMGNDDSGTTHIFKRGKGYYGYNDEFDFEASSKEELQQMLDKWGYELLAGSLEESVNELDAATYRSALEKGRSRGDSKGRGLATNALNLLAKKAAQTLAGQSFEVAGSRENLAKGFYRGDSKKFINQFLMTFTGEGSLISPSKLDTVGSDEVHFNMKVEFQPPDNQGGWSTDLKFKGYNKYKFPGTVQFSIKEGRVWVWYRAAETDLEFTRAGARAIAKLADMVAQELQLKTPVKHNSIKQFDPMKPSVEESKKLTFNDFVRMVRDDMMAGSAPDERPSEELVGKRAKAYYNDYLQGASVDDLFEATKEEENEFHTKLDKLVHKTFGPSSDEKEEMNEGASTEEKRIAMRAIRSIAKYRNVSNEEARNDLIRAANEIGELKEEEGYSKFLEDDPEHPGGKTKGLTPDVLNKILMKVIKDLDELKQLGEGMIEEELCEKGKAYRKKRMAAGEKSSAYLNGRAVKVCKGQMKG